MGSFVDVDKNVVGLDDMYQQIDATIDYTRTYADEMRTSLSNAVTDLQAVVGSYNPQIEDVDTSLDPIDRPIFPAKPNLPEYESTCVLDHLMLLEQLDLIFLQDM